MSNGNGEDREDRVIGVKLAAALELVADGADIEEAALTADVAPTSVTGAMSDLRGTLKRAGVDVESDSRFVWLRRKQRKGGRREGSVSAVDFLGLGGVGEL